MGWWYVFLLSFPCLSPLLGSGSLYLRLRETPFVSKNTPSLRIEFVCYTLLNEIKMCWTKKINLTKSVHVFICFYEWESARDWLNVTLTLGRNQFSRPLWNEACSAQWRISSTASLEIFVFAQRADLLNEWIATWLKSRLICQYLGISFVPKTFSWIEIYSLKTSRQTFSDFNWK